MGSAPSTSYALLPENGPPEYHVLKSLEHEDDEHDGVMIGHALDVKASTCTPNPSRNVLLYLLQSQCETMIALADCAKVRIDMGPTRVCHEAIRLYLGMKKSFRTRTTSDKYDFEPRLEACMRVMDTSNMIMRLYQSHTVGNKQAEGFVASYDEVKRRADALLGRILDTV